MRSYTADLAALRASCRSGEAKRIRQAAQVSLAEIAQEVGTTPATVGRWETGVRLPRPEAALRYAAVLGRLRQILDSRGSDGDAA